MKCNECGQEKPFELPKLLSVRISELKRDVDNAMAIDTIAFARQVLSILEELEKRPYINFFSTPTGVVPPAPYVPPVYIPPVTPNTTPWMPNPPYPNICGSGDTNRDSSRVVALNSTKTVKQSDGSVATLSSVPDATGTSPWEGPDSYGG